MVLTALAGLVAFFVAAPAAGADEGTEADAAAATFLDGARLYVSPDSGQKLDEGKLADVIGEDPLYIAVVPPNISPQDVSLHIINALPEKMTLVVVSGTEYHATSNAICAEHAQPLLQQAAEDNADARQQGDLTTWLTEYAELVSDAPATCDGEGDGAGLGSTLLWILGALVLGGAIGFFWYRSQHTKRESELSAQRAELDALLQRLSDELDRTGTGHSELADLALQDAEDRYAAARAAADEADHDEDFDAARRACWEGLAATAYAQEALGRPTERPQLPDPPDGEQLSTPVEVAFGDDRVVGYPDYTPGAPYYYPGGAGYPGGWYSAPFWDEALIGSMLGEGEQDENDSLR